VRGGRKGKSRNRAERKGWATRKPTGTIVERYGKSCNVHACMPATVVGLFACERLGWVVGSRFGTRLRGRRHKREGEDLVL